MKKILILLVVLSVFFIGVSYAVIPTTITLQGKIDGMQIPSSQKTMQLNFAFGHTLQSGSFAIDKNKTVTANINSNGIFSAQVDVSDVKFANPFTYEVFVSTLSEPVITFNPPIKLSSVPYALNSDKVGGIGISQIVTRDASTGQIIGAGVSTPPLGESFIDTSTSKQTKKGSLFLGSGDTTSSIATSGAVVAEGTIQNGVVGWTRSNATRAGVVGVNSSTSSNGVSNGSYGLTGSQFSGNYIGVYGESQISGNVRNYGVLGYGNPGIGVYGRGRAEGGLFYSSADNGASGVSGSIQKAGLVGLSDGSSQSDYKGYSINDYSSDIYIGVYGETKYAPTGHGYGVYGYSNVGTGVYGRGTAEGGIFEGLYGNGVIGWTRNNIYKAGVVGVNASSGNDIITRNYAGPGTSDNPYVGVYGEDQHQYGAGVYAKNTQKYGDALVADGDALFKNDVYINGGIIRGGSKYSAANHFSHTFWIYSGNHSSVAETFNPTPQYVYSLVGCYEDTYDDGGTQRKMFRGINPDKISLKLDAYGRYYVDIPDWPSNKQGHVIVLYN